VSTLVYEWRNGRSRARPLRGPATRPVATDGLIGVYTIINDYSECTTLSFRRWADLRAGNTTRETHSARPAVDTVHIESLRDKPPQKACPWRPLACMGDP
jgi:hypothetical protein